jgi:copper chaperone
MNKISLNVPNISCQHCVKTIEFELNKLPGVKTVSASPDLKVTEVEFEEPATEEEIINLLGEINYPVKK